MSSQKYLSIKIKFLYLQKTNIQNPITKLGQQVQQVQIHANPGPIFGFQSEFNHQAKHFDTLFTKHSEFKSKLSGNSSFRAPNEFTTSNTVHANPLEDVEGPYRFARVQIVKQDLRTRTCSNSKILPKKKKQKTKNCDLEDDELGF